MLGGGDQTFRSEKKLQMLVGGWSEKNCDSAGGWPGKNCNSAGGWSEKNCNSAGGGSEESSVVTPH